MIEVVCCTTKKARRAFFSCYPTTTEGNEWGGRPFLSTEAYLSDPRRNPLLPNGPHAFLLVLADGKPVMRALTGIDRLYAKETGLDHGYFSLFGGYNREDAAAALLSEVRERQRLWGASRVVGPNPPDASGFGYGVLIQGFDTPAEKLFPGNPPYYEELLLGNGFLPEADFYGYRFSLDRLNNLRHVEAAGWAAERFGLSVDGAHLGAFSPDIRAIYEIISGDGATDPYAFQRILGRLRRLTSPEFCLIARHGKRPVGFLLCTIEDPAAVTIITMHIAEPYRTGAASVCLLGRLLSNVSARGIATVRAAVIRADNGPSNRMAQRGGGVIERTFRRFVMKIS